MLQEFKVRYGVRLWLDLKWLPPEEERLRSVFDSDSPRRGAVSIPITKRLLEEGVELEALRALFGVLPEDAKLHRLHDDPITSKLHLIVTSVEFPPTPDGCLLKELEVEFTRHPDGKITADLISLGGNGLDRAFPKLCKRRLTE